MRVLHVYSGNLYGGVERLLRTLAEERAACPAMEPSFALCFDGQIARELRDTGATVDLLAPARLSRPWTVLRARRALARVIRDRRPDVVLLHSVWPLVVLGPVPLALGVPTALFLHDLLGTHPLERWARTLRPALVLCNSAFVAASARGAFGGAEVAVVPLPVPAPPAGSQLSRDAVRSELGAPPGAVVVLMASRLERWKGHSLLLDALGALRADPSWRCWITGGPQRPHERAYLDELRARALRLGIAERVRFLGHRADMPGLMAAADIHCQPNLGPEPFGIAFVEAMHAGLPVVATALGGAPEVVPETAGLLVAPRADEVAAALSRLLGSPELRASLGQAGQAHARDFFSPARRAAELTARLERLTSIPAPTAATVA
ncbi:MAG TPA: glycosyltransferase family 4 protein [Myxococcales bacterium]|nr:glycosyltransferase family 4 protein [Myxococcales bacterium]